MLWPASTARAPALIGIADPVAVRDMIAGVQLTARRPPMAGRQQD
jgi:hypothetical protein